MGKANELLQKQNNSLKEDLNQKQNLLVAADRKATTFEAQFKAEYEASKKLHKTIEELNLKIKDLKSDHKTELAQIGEKLTAQHVSEIASMKRQFDLELDDHRKLASDEVAARDTEIAALRKMLQSLQGYFCFYLSWGSILEKYFFVKI